MTAFIQQIYQDQIRERVGLLTNCFYRNNERLQDESEPVRVLRLSLCEMLTYLDCRGVEKSPHHVLTAAVGRQVERGQTTLAGQLSHQALGLGCRDLTLS